MPSYRSPSFKVVLVIAAIGAAFAWQRTRQAAESTTVPRSHPATAATPAAHGVEFDFYLLALHGLWPENRESRTSPRDCPASPLDLQAGLAAELEPYMPGMVDGLQEHEWREHGGCTGLDDDQYFSRALELTRGVESALGARLTTMAGNETDPQTLRAAAELYQPGIGAMFYIAP